LRKKAQEVRRETLETQEFQQLLVDMIETMRAADGAGLAAPQIFESLQLCVIELSNNPRYPNVAGIPLTVLVNPRIEPLVPNPHNPSDADTVALYEGCLSVPGLRGRVRRPRRVRVTAWDQFGNAIDEEWEGMRAAVVQHETDHLHGMLFVDRADPATLTYLDEYERHVPADRRFFDGLPFPDGNQG
jgi:peptide deformylase